MQQSFRQPWFRYDTNLPQSTSITGGWLGTKKYMMDCRGAPFVWLGLPAQQKNLTTAAMGLLSPHPFSSNPKKKTFLLFVGKSRESEVKPQEQHVIGCCGVKERVERPPTFPK